MLFHRDYRGYTGGHGKVRDYIAHVDAHPAWQAAVYLTPGSLRGADNPFLDVPGLTDRWAPQAADALLLGGMDWNALPGPASPADDADPVRMPIVNLVQHVRHADPDHPLHAFLPRRAIRVCVSTAVAEAIRATGRVDGPVRVIAAAVDVADLARVGAMPVRRDVFVDAVKQPVLGEQVATALRREGLDVGLHAGRCERTGYLASMAEARIVVTLPDPVEGFYLPGLEALAMGRELVQYDCLGSRDYLCDGVNALVPARDAASIVRAVLRLHADRALGERLRAGAGATAAAFDLPAERAQVHALLDELDGLWHGHTP